VNNKTTSDKITPQALWSSALTNTYNFKAALCFWPMGLYGVQHVHDTGKEATQALHLGTQYHQLLANSSTYRMHCLSMWKANKQAQSNSDAPSMRCGTLQASEDRAVALEQLH
jgi:hypothetical protein